MKNVKKRMKHIINRETGKIMLMPMDHGVSCGPIDGLENIGNSIDSIYSAPINGLVLHKGSIMRYQDRINPDHSVLLHLSASTDLSPEVNSKVLVASVEDALRLGVDGISIHVNVGAYNDYAMLKDFGEISSKCLEFGIPLLAMVYPRGRYIANDDKNIIHTTRMAMELGADMVKVPMPKNLNLFEKITSCVDIPVLIAGGNKGENNREVLEIISKSMDCGCGGVAIGRNCFQHENPTSFIRSIDAIVNRKASVNEALDLLENSNLKIASAIC